MTSASMTRTLSGSRSSLNKASCVQVQKVGGLSSRSALALVLAAAVIVGATLFFVWSRTAIVAEGYDLSQLSGEIKELTAENEQLLTRAAQLRSPDRIETIASEELGMCFPTSEQIRNVEWRERDSERHPSVAIKKLASSGASLD